MNYIKLIALMIVVASANNSFAQNVSYKDLIGTWEKTNAKSEKVTYEFRDSSTVKITSANGNSSNANYALSRQDQQTKITIESRAEGIKIIDEYFIKLDDAGTLRMENLNSYNPGPQLPTKTMAASFRLLRQSKPSRHKG